jgi:hypothetical protein
MFYKQKMEFQIWLILINQFNVVNNLNIQYLATMDFMSMHTLSKLYFNPKALQWPYFGHCYFRHAAMIRRCDMIFWEFYSK